MPQPLSRVHPNPEVQIRASAISSNPQWAADVMRVIAHWAHIEGDLAAIMGKLLKTDVKLTTAMYQAVVNSDAKRTMVATAVKSAGLREWQVVLFDAVQKATKASREQRNDFAHGVWGVCKQVPNAVLLMRPRVIIERNARSLARNALDATPTPYDTTQIMVYRQRDFDKAAHAAMSAEYYHSMLFLIIGEMSTEQARRQLLNEPPIQQAVQALTREKSAELQDQLRPPKDGEPPPRGVYSTWDEYWDRIEAGEPDHLAPR